MAQKIKKDTKTIKDIDIIAKVGPHPSILFVLIDEAMRSHRERDYGNLFNYVLALQNILRRTSRIKTTSNPYEDLVELVNHRPIMDSTGNKVYLNIHTLMRAALYNYQNREDYIQDLIDYKGNKVYIQISDLLKEYDYIGQKLIYILACILYNHQIDLPKEMYTTHSMQKYEY